VGSGSLSRRAAIGVVLRVKSDDERERKRERVCRFVDTKDSSMSTSTIRYFDAWMIPRPA
jgi:hypothetical protein